MTFNMKSQDKISTQSVLVSRHQSTVKRRWIRARDLLTLISLVICQFASVALPQRVWVALCRGLAQMLPLWYFGLATSKKIASGLNISQDAARTVMRNTLAAQLISMFTFLRARSLGLAFDIEIEGKEHLDKALSEGRGVVLWIADLVFAGDICKIALAGQGYAVSHLSRPEHGFSDSRFGLKFLNPIRHKFELRYLRERIIYRRERPNEAGDLLRQRLQENGIVSIMASGYEGRAMVETDFLNGRLSLAGGAPRLAFKEKCPVIPVFVYSSSNAKSFTVALGEPLKRDSRDKNIAVLVATADFLDRLTPVVKSRPELWRAWAWFLPKS